MKRIGLGTLAVLGIVVAVGVFALRPDTLPAWARIGSAQAVDSGPGCEEHGVPEKFCTICHPELKEKLLLCPEHGNIPEEICTLCHPEAEKKYAIKMCKEHGLPEHFCIKCGKGPSAAAENLIDDGYCAANGEPAGPDGKPKYCKLLPVVRLASAQLGRDIGLKTIPVTEVEHTHELAANAETAYDANRYAEISPRVAGFLREARMDLGQKVRGGEVIAVVDSSAVSTAKTHYLSSFAALRLSEDTYKRIKSLTEHKAVPAKQEISTRTAMNQAQSDAWNAEQTLRNFHFDDAALAQVIKTNDTRPLLEITTPIGGTVVFRHAVRGEAIEPTAKLYTVADVSKIWAWIDVYEKDVARLQTGQAVSFTVSGASSTSEEATFSGRITWIGTEVDRTTRTTKVRAELPNPEGKLRAHQFGLATIRIGAQHKAVTIAKAAVQRYEDADLVFLPQGEGTYRPQRIRTLPIGRGETLEVTWGLKPGQEVVTTGAFLLKTEIMKGSIGAGCCD